jgi:hypothetical protein
LSDEVPRLIKNWYDASIFFLNRAEFLRRHDMRSLQAIAILLGLIKNMGDFDLQSSLLSVGMCIAQHLGMDKEPPSVSENPIEQELSRRIWWTLVICDWLQRPVRAACIQEAEFQVNLPGIMNDDEIGMRTSADADDTYPRPIQYHIAMIRLAQEYHRFASKLPIMSDNAAELKSFVLEADESLARTIDELPPHLTMSGQINSQVLEEHTPWAQWQRKNLALTLLFYRLNINRVLQHQWLSCDVAFKRARAICLSSAKAIISLVDGDSDTLVLYRSW